MSSARRRKAFEFLGAALLALGFAGAGSAQASSPLSPRESNSDSQALAVVGVGSCDPVLANSTRALREALRALEPERILSEGDTAKLVGGAKVQDLLHGAPNPVASKIKEGREIFLNIEFLQAEQVLREALAEVESLPLGAERWQCWTEARAQLARVYVNLGKPEESAKLHAEILGADLDYRLDPYEYPPSARAAMERIREALKVLPQVKLTVTTPRPGVPVYVESRLLGQTPLESALRVGYYNITVGDRLRRGFTRRVALGSDTHLEIDVEREAKLVGGQGPCYAIDGGDEQRLDAVLEVAGALGASGAVALWQEDMDGTPYLVATLLDGARSSANPKGKAVRQVSAANGLGDQVDFAQLATYLLRGEVAGPGGALVSAPALHDAPRRLDLSTRQLPREQEEAPAPLTAAPTLAEKPRVEENPTDWHLQGKSASPSPTASPEAKRLMRYTGYGLGVATLVLTGLALYGQSEASAAQRSKRDLEVGSGGAVKLGAESDWRSYDREERSAIDLRNVTLGAALLSGAATGTFFYFSFSRDSANAPVVGAGISGEF